MTEKYIIPFFSLSSFCISLQRLLAVEAIEMKVDSCLIRCISLEGTLSNTEIYFQFPFSELLHVSSVLKVSSHFEYLNNQLHDLDATCQPTTGNLSGELG